VAARNRSRHLLSAAGTYIRPRGWGMRDSNEQGPVHALAARVLLFRAVRGRPGAPVTKHNSRA